MHGYTNEGFKIKTFSDIVADIEENYKARLGNSDYALDFNTPEGLFSEAMSYEFTKIWEQMLFMDNMRNIDTAQGVYLDYLGVLYGTKRIQGQRSQGKIKLTFSEKPEADNIDWGSALILKGKEYYAYNVDNIEQDGKTYFIRVMSLGFTEDYEIAAGKVFKDRFYAKPATVEIIESIKGGLENEPDSLFRRRIKNRKRKSEVATKQALVEALNSVEGVNSVIIADPETTPATQAGSIKIFVDGRPGRAIAEKILETKADGILTLKEENAESYEEEFEDASGYKRKIIYNMVSNSELKIKVEIKETKGKIKDGPELVKQVKNEISKYINSLSTGEDLHYIKLYAEVLGIDEIKKITLAISVDGSSPAVQEFDKIYSPGISGKYVINTENIEVVFNG